MIRRAAAFLCLLVSDGSSFGLRAGETKNIVDQDARGPATTDQQSMLALIQAPQAEVLGLTIVSGDQWRDEEVAHTLRMLELTNHPEIKVYPGAIFPLINSKEEIARWSKLYGKVRYQGAWTKNGTGKFVREVHGPYEMPELPEGNPTLKAEAEDAAHFIIRMVHKYPHEVTIYAGGPMTNIAPGTEPGSQGGGTGAGIGSDGRKYCTGSFRWRGRRKIGGSLISGGTRRRCISCCGRRGRRLR